MPSSKLMKNGLLRILNECWTRKRGTRRKEGRGGRRDEENVASSFAATNSAADDFVVIVVVIVVVAIVVAVVVVVVGLKSRCFFSKVITQPTSLTLGEERIPATLGMTDEATFDEKASSATAIGPTVIGAMVISAKAIGAMVIRRASYFNTLSGNRIFFGSMPTFQHDAKIPTCINTLEKISMKKK